MQVKGTVVLTLPLFIEETFGKEALNRWVSSLSDEARGVYSCPISSSSWYPTREILVVPTQKICELFYNGNIRGAWEAGRFSANHGLKGIYKAFVEFGSIQFLINKANTILPTYYSSCSMLVVELSGNLAILHITKCQSADQVIEQRIGGWVERAIEISGCKDVKVEITKSLTKGDIVTEFLASWT